MIGETLGAVLAGGHSRRLGRDKALLELVPGREPIPGEERIPGKGRTLVGRAVAVLASVFPRVVLVAPDRSEYEALGVERVGDRWPEAGPLAGIEAALVAAGGRPAFVLACDLPLVDAGLVAALARVTAEFGAAGPAARLAAAGELLQPLCALYSASCGEVVRRALERGVRAVHEALREIRCQRFEVAPDRLLNVNTEADVARLRELEAAWAS